MSTRSSSYEILRNRGFRHLLTGRFLFSFAIQMQMVVVGWQVYELTKDPLYLGFVGLAAAVPAISLALVAGHVVDRGNPLRIYRAMIALSLAATATLLAASIGALGDSTQVKLGAIFSAVVAVGVVRSFAWPSEFALLARVLERKWFGIAATWRTTVLQVSMMTGPALGGVIYAWKGPRAAYAAALCLLAGAASLIARIKLGQQPARAEAQAKEPVLRSLTAGVRFVFSNQIILGALALDLFAVFFGGATALLPIFAAEILRSGPGSLGILRAAPAVGALATSFALIHRPLGRRAGPMLFGAVACYGLCMIGFGLSRTLWVSVLMLGLSGMFDAVSVVTRHTILQLWTPDEMRGRVSAVNMIFIGSSNEIGEFESGVAARLLGAAQSVIFGGVMTLLVVASASRLAPRLRKLELDAAVIKK